MSKGSRNRTDNPSQYRDNYSRIDWGGEKDKGKGFTRDSLGGIKNIPVDGPTKKQGEN